MSGRVVAAGGVVVEECVRVEALPGVPGVRFGRSVELRVGGPAALEAVAAAQVGAATRCVGTVGTDPAGAAVRRHLARADVDVTTLLPMPGPTSRMVRHLPDPVEADVLAATLAGAASLLGESVAPEDSLLGEEDEPLLILPGASWGCGGIAVEHALARCEPGDVLLLDWSALDSTGSLVAAAYDLDLQIVALFAPYPQLPQELDLRSVDVVITDRQGAAWLADSGEAPGSLCVLVGRRGLSWDGETIVAPVEELPMTTAASRADALPERGGSRAHRGRVALDRAYAVIAGAISGRLACGDDRPDAAKRALEVLAAMERASLPRRGLPPPGGWVRGASPWGWLRLDPEELG
ncbi:MAG: PfkB family carbohydrate kinase [Dermatophilaceae bacterium]